MKINGVTLVGGSSTILLTGQTLSSASWSFVSGYYTYTFYNQNIVVTSRGWTITG